MRGPGKLKKENTKNSNFSGNESPGKYTNFTVFNIPTKLTFAEV